MKKTLPRDLHENKENGKITKDWSHDYRQYLGGGLQKR